MTATNPGIRSEATPADQDLHVDATSVDKKATSLVNAQAQTTSLEGASTVDRTAICQESARSHANSNHVNALEGASAVVRTAIVSVTVLPGRLGRVSRRGALTVGRMVTSHESVLRRGNNGPVSATSVGKKDTFQGTAQKKEGRGAVTVGTEGAKATPVTQISSSKG
jgi:hypothetical protein